jgi:outer membrane protein assembly factor BamB
VVITALRARDGAVIWRSGSARLHYRLLLLRILYALRVTIREFSLRAGLSAFTSLRLAGNSISLAAGGGRLLVGIQPATIALDASSGACRWMSTRFGRLYGLFAARGGRLFVGAARGLTALDAHTGRVAWSYDRGTDPREAAFGDERVHFLTHTSAGSGRGRPAIATLSLVDGRVQQLFALPDSDANRSVHLLHITDSGIAYLIQDGSLRAIHIEDEVELWRVASFEHHPADPPSLALAVPPSTDEPPALAYAYRAPPLPTYSLRIGALSPQSGAIVWQWRGEPGPMYGHGGLRVTAALGNVYVSAVDGIRAFSAADGRLLWQLPAGFSQSPLLAAVDGRESPRRQQATWPY